MGWLHPRTQLLKKFVNPLASSAIEGTGPSVNSVEAGSLRTLRTMAHPGNAAVEKIQVYVRFKKSIMTNELHSIGGNRIQSSVLVDIVRVIVRD